MGQYLGKQGIFQGRTSSIECLLILQHSLCVVGDVGPEVLEMGMLLRGVPREDGAWASQCSPSSGGIRSSQGGRLEATEAEPGQIPFTANVQPGVQSSYFTDVGVLTAETGSQLLYPGG